MNLIIKLSAASSIITILYSLYLIKKIYALPAGEKKMTDIADAIAEGAKAYLTRQYKAVSIVAALIFIILWIALGMNSALGFALGAIASALAGFVGMMVAVKSNVRTANAAKKGLNAALQTAFKGGSVT